MTDCCGGVPCDGGGKKKTVGVERSVSWGCGGSSWCVCGGVRVRKVVRPFGKEFVLVNSGRLSSQESALKRLRTSERKLVLNHILLSSGSRRA